MPSRELRAAAHTYNGLKVRHLINGELEDSPRRFSVIDPATEQPIADCPEATRDQLDRAVAGAVSAQRAWASIPVSERRLQIGRLAKVLLEHKDELARLITLEVGKPLTASLAEIQRAADSMLEITSVDIRTQVIRTDDRGVVELHFRPLGVIGAITPWNVPIALAAPKVASALYAGNSVVLKPSPNTPLATLRFGELVQDVLSPGLFNVLAGGNDCGQWMSEHPDIRKINFTGSVATGKRVMASAAGTLKRLTLELGGNDPAIVLEDAEVDKVAPKLFMGAFGLSGQVCMAIKRLYVHESIYERMVEAMTTLAQTVKVGDGFEDGVLLGPIQNKAQFAKVMALIEETKRLPNVRITTGGHALNRNGYFIAPTIVADILEGTRLVDEEPFGPILPILSFATEDEAIERANNSSFGLGGSVWTRDLRRGAQLAARLEAGFTWVNHHVGTTRDLPFGGVKESGLGRQGHAIGVQSDMEAQVVVVPPVSSQA